MTSISHPIVLQGQHGALVPLTAAHHDDLVEAVRDGELWRHWYTTVPAPEAMAAEIERRLGLQSQGSMIPFAVVSAASGRAPRPGGRAATTPTCSSQTAKQGTE